MKNFNITRIGREEWLCEPWLGTTSAGIFRGDDPLKYTTPLLLLLISLVSSLSSFFQLLLRPLANVDFLTQILAGIFLGPSGLRHNADLVMRLFNPRSFFIIESLEAFAFVFIAYLTTAQVDMGVIKRGGKVAVINGFSLFLCPYIVASMAASFISKAVHGSVAKTTVWQLHDLATNESIVYFQVAYAVLSNLKMLNSEPGRLALASIMVSNCFSWAFFILYITFNSFLRNNYSRRTHLPTLSRILLIACIVAVCRPIFKWIVKRTPPGKKLKGSHLCIICIMLCVTTFLSETVGFPHVVGSVVLGLVTPSTPPLGPGLIEKLETFCSTILMPCYVISVGSKVDFFTFRTRDVIILEFIFFTIQAAKFAAIFVPSVYFKVPKTQAAVTGFVVCIQGLYDVQIFKQMLNYKNVSNEAFGIMVVSAMVHSTIFTAVVKNLYSWTQRRNISQRRKTIQYYEPDNLLKILTCFRHHETVPPILTILELTCPVPNSLLSVVSINLEDLEHQAVPLLIEHQLGDDTIVFSSNRREQILNVFRSFESQHTLQENVTIKCFTAISPSKTMHEDVCNLALDRESDLIIMALDHEDASERRLCHNLLNSSPCSLAILLDNGRLPDFKNMGPTRSNNHTRINACAIFLGGADDREALSLAARISNHPNLHLQVLVLTDTENVSLLTDVIERKLDFVSIEKFRRAALSKQNVTLREIKIKEASDIVNLLREEGNNYDLILYGIGHEEGFEVLKGLSVWSENDELGEIGDLLVSRDLKLTSSILAVHQQRSQQSTAYIKACNVVTFLGIVGGIPLFPF